MDLTLPEKTASLSEILDKLQLAGSPANVEGMARYGIRPALVYGVGTPVLRQFARALGKNTALAAQLWDTGIHDARFLAMLIANPKEVSSEQADAWARTFDSWALCDSTCIHLIRKTPFAWSKVDQWAAEQAEFVRRASLALIATLAVHDKHASASQLKHAQALATRLAGDKRPLIQKAIKWALRSIQARKAKLQSTR